uniref:BTB domain-containing protein n=1 Tax=Hymenolepis diminuta TaxID=6216 RepID=A0A0R3SYV2_HYMDI
LEECEIYDFLRQKKKFFDLKIIGEHDTSSWVVLSRRFKHLIKVLPDSADSLVDWSRFPHEIVEAVLSFAYTGSITINSENVLQLLLFAYNLRSGQLIEWCNDFLASRINVDNVVDIWVVANVTVNEDLISSCLTTIRDHIDDLIDDSRFVAYTEPKGMAMMICDESILSEVGSSSENHESTSSPTDQLLTKWLSNSESNTLGTSVDVLTRFEDLISSLNLQSIPIKILGELGTKAIELNATKAFMLKLADAMAAPRQLSENTPTMLHSVDKK